jgi:hypothetical protein
MTIPTYNLGYPPDGASLGETKAEIRNNLDGTFLTLGVDHINNNGQPGSNPAGYHNNIHMVTQGAAPANMAGVLQLFTLVPPSGIPDATNPQLFTLTNSILSQLTGKKTTAANNSNGYVWVGGVLIQWGIASTPHESATPLLFATNNVAFPNFCFMVQVTGIRSNSGGDGIFVLQGSVSNTGFTFRNGSGSIDNSYWMAIGN